MIVGKTTTTVTTTTATTTGASLNTHPREHANHEGPYPWLLQGSRRRRRGFGRDS